MFIGFGLGFGCDSCWVAPCVYISIVPQHVAPEGIMQGPCTCCLGASALVPAFELLFFSTSACRCNMYLCVLIGRMAVCYFRLHDTTVDDVCTDGAKGPSVTCAQPRLHLFAPCIVCPMYCCLMCICRYVVSLYCLLHCSWQRPWAFCTLRQARSCVRHTGQVCGLRVRVCFIAAHACDAACSTVAFIAASPPSFLSTLCAMFVAFECCSTYAISACMRPSVQRTLCMFPCACRTSADHTSSHNTKCSVHLPGEFYLSNVLRGKKAAAAPVTPDTTTASATATAANSA